MPRLIARFCAERKPPLWEPSAPELAELRALVTRRDSLERMRTQEINRLHVSCGQVRSGVEEHIAFLEKAVQAIDAEIQRKTDGDASLKKQRELLDSIPGSGAKTMLSFFSRARQAAAPRQHESGSSVRRKPRISKMGYAFFRKTSHGHHLRYDAQACSCLRPHPQVRQNVRSGPAWCLTRTIVSTSNSYAGGLMKGRESSGRQ
ncbi:MAG: hypothetical protein ACTFAL_15000 [Candidatus Electronema sp. V4]|uniref:hypothetical protein n=1 Tax=Candidatus Electronema sp. V4 TaxID=3454756 RepID=UPI00405569DE